jgi:GT2 family glycosyltransferase
MTPRVSVITPIFNRKDITRQFLQSFAGVTYPNFEIIVIDDGSTDGSADAIQREFPSVRVFRTEGNLWWSRATNVGVRDAISRGADFILTINDDVILDPEFLTHLVDRAVPNPRMLVGAMIYAARPPHNLWYAGGKFSWWTGQIPHRASVDDGPLYWLTGMGTLIPVGAFAEIGMYDEKHFPQYVGDVDFTLRAAKHGYALSIAERSRIYNRTEESIQRLIRQHVTLRNFFVPLFSNKSDSKIGMRLTLYRRYWPTLLAPIAFCAYYAVFFAKQTTRLLRGLR